jgi:hypothetical protein
MKTNKLILSIIIICSCRLLSAQMSERIGTSNLIANSEDCIPGLFANSDMNSINDYNNPTNDRTVHTTSLANNYLMMDEKGKSYPLSGKSLFFNLQIGSSSLINDDIEKGEWISNNQLGYQFEFGYARRLRGLRINNVRLFSYGVGLGVSSYSYEITSNSIYDTIQVMDPENITPRDPMEKRPNYLSISEKTNVLFIDVPLFIEIGKVSAYRVGYYARFGIKASFPLSDKFEGMGNYSVKGYYENIEGDFVDCEIVTEIPELGLYHNAQLYSGNKNYELNSINLSGFIAAGVSLPVVEKKWIIRIGANYIQGFSDITAPSNLTDNIIQTDVNHVMENDNSPTKTRFFGAEIGLQYVINTN